MATNRIPLADLIKTVADELRQIRNEHVADPVIQLAECELELAVQVTTEGKAGIKVWVFELGGDRSKSNTNTVRVKFTPVGDPVTYVAEGEGDGPPLGRKTKKTTRVN